LGRKATIEALDWLLAGDPAIRWQALRDLAGANPRTVEREREKVATEGWGARLLARQDPDGTWASGLYSPKWKSTTYTALALRDLGLPVRNKKARAACALLLDEGLCRDGGINYGFWRQSETCVTGMVLSILSYFRYDDERLDTVADHLLRQQMPDGGWNCRRPRGATHASMHTTISVLEGLRMYERRGRGRARAARSAQSRGREFLLRHRLFRSHRTGEVIKSEFVRLAYPPRWHYDILRALDYFREVEAPRDERLSDAVSLLEEKRRADGRWNLEHRYRGKVFFEMERLGMPSRWNTLRALRVMRWWRGA
jgi:hypothetical protein